MYWWAWDLNLKIRLFGEMLFQVFFWMYYPFIALYFSDAFGKELASFLLMIPPLLGVFANLFGGNMSDRLGRRPTMLLGAFLQAAMFGLFAFSPSPWIDYVAFIGIGIGGAIYWPASTAMVADLTPEEDRRLVFATFYTATNIGVVIGPVLGSFFFLHHRTGLLIACMAVCLAYGIVLSMILKETRPPSDQAKQPVAGLSQQLRSYYLIFRDKLFAYYTLAGVLISVVFMQLDLYLAVYVKEHVPEQMLLHWNDWRFILGGTEAFGWMVGLNGLLVVLLTLSVTRWFASWSDRNSLIVSSILYGLGMFFMGFTSNLWLLFGCIVVLTFGELIRTPVAQSFISKYAPEDKRGQYMGASSLQFTIGRFLAPVIISFSTWLTPQGVFTVILLLALASALLYAFMFRYLRSASSQPMVPSASERES